MKLLYPTEVALPPGKYVIGDPCYFVPDESWGSVLEGSNYFNMGGNGTCHASFRRTDGEVGFVAAFSTAHGDGEYRDNSGRAYGVDSGSIGIIPLGDVQGPVESSGHVVEFTDFFRCSAKDGVLTFGHVVINTDFEDEELDLDEDDGDSW